MFTSENATNSCSSFNTKRSIEGFIMNKQRVRKTEKKKRGKVFSHQLSQHDHHENDRLDVHFKYIFCVSLNLKSATFLGLQSDKGQIEFNLRESL